MSHVDDGMLEVWLDRDRSGIGPDEALTIERHIEACAECQARLAEARMFRDRADTILAGSGPSEVFAPGFDEIAARAITPRLPTASPSARPSPVWRRRFIAAAWAASFVGAIGLGWLARESMRTDQIALLETRAEVVLIQESDSPVPVGARAAGTAVESLDTPVSIQSSPPPAASAMTSGAAASTVDPVATEVADVTVAGDLAAADRPPALPGPPPPPPPVVPPLAYQADRAAPEPVAGADAVAQPEVRSLAARASDSLPAAAAAPAIAPAARQAETLAAGPPVAWTSADLAQAEIRLGVAPVTIPGLPIAGVELNPQADVRHVRVTQTLDDGSPLVLTQWPATDAANAPVALTPNSPVITARHGDLIVSATAALDIAHLGALLPLIPPP